MPSRKTNLSLVRHQTRDEREASLISWIAKGDEAAFRVFFEATNGLLFGLLLRILGHTQTAEEVLSELYEEVRQKAARFGKQNERPLTWLIFIAHRRAIECLCRRLTTQELSRELARKAKSITHSESFINITEQRRLIRATMDSIPQLHQQMIELAFFSGMTNLEIARALGQSPDEVEEGLQGAMLLLFGLFKSIGFSRGPATEHLQSEGVPS